MYTYDDVSLLKLDQGNLAALWKLKQESWLNTHQITINTMEEQEAWFDSLDHDAHAPRNLVLVADGPVANFGIFKIFNVDYVNRSADVGWDIFEDYRGQGLGKKLVAAGSSFAIRMLNLHRLNAEILTINIASQHCAEAAGYLAEGRRREAVHKMGEYVDSVIYGLLSSDAESTLQHKTKIV